MDNIWILAQAQGDQAPSSVSSEPITDEGEMTVLVQSEPNSAAAGTQRKGLFGDYGTLVFLALCAVLFYFILFRGPQKQKQQHKQMVRSLKKNDRVRTIGGIIGTVVDIKGEEITLKVDESNNTKIRVATSAIGRNLSNDNKS